MPRVKGFTLAEQRKRDRMAKALHRHGFSLSRSYAISTAQVKKGKRKRKR